MDFDLVKSYLQARDPSIIENNKVNLDSVKMNLADLLKNNSTETEAEEKTEDIKFINVYLRIRGDIKISEIYKIEDNKFSCKVPEGSYALRNVKYGDSMRRIYTFSNIFGPEFNQKTIFEIIVKQKLISFINGRNSTLFTYGASGSGKTYTIVGTPEQPGLIPRALEYVFKSVPKVSLKPEVKPLPNGCVQNITGDMIIENEKYKNFIVSATLCDQAAHIRTYKQMQNRLSMEPIAKVIDDSDVFVSVWISFAEIYNESIYDLLSLPDLKGKPRPRLALGKSKDESTYIKKLISLHVTNGLEAYQILQYGLHNLNYASTSLNSHSSRSHCIFTIRLVQTSKNNQDVFISNFNFCDLAGSERLKKTMNFGDRLKESNNINTSLLVLGRCIDNIKKFQQAKDNRLIPFRESKLTQIFQKALMGYEHVDMIVNVNLCRDMFDETIHALNFSALANTIVVEEELPKAIKREMMQNEEKTEFQKVTTNKQSEFETLQKELYESQKENKRLLTENNRLNDPNGEVKRLNDAIDIIIEERDNIIAIYEKRIIEEKESVAAIYKESIARYEKIYMENKESALKRQRQEYEEKIAEMQTIVISSDDDDESPQTSRDARRKELEEKMLGYQTAIGELSDNVRKTQEKLEFTENVLEDANEENRCLQLEIERIRHENSELKSNVVELKEEIESLKLQLTDQSLMYFHESLSGTDGNEPRNVGFQCPLYLLPDPREITSL